MSKVLLVEDDEFMVKALSFELKNQGFEVLRASDGQEGLDLALEEHPDVITLDLMMPKMDGIEFLKKLRQDSWGGDVPVIILTNMGYPGRSEEAAELGADYMVKSNVDLEEIVEQIKEKAK